MTSRRADIDGLRAVAVISVLLFHAKFSAFAGGFVGVDVFFVISGLVITETILRNIHADRFSYSDFYARRARRIFPALALVILATIVAGWFVLWPLDYRKLAEQAIAGALFVPNFLFWKEAGYFDSAADLKPLLHLWSLGIEEQFYLIWPFVIFSLAKHRRALIAFLAVATIASFLYCLHMTTVNPVAAFHSPLSRMWELSLGGAVAIIGFQPKSRSTRATIFVAGLVAIGVAVLTFHPGENFPGYRAALPTLGAAAILWTGLDNPVARYTLSLKPVAYIGLISYPLYLWHWPILSLSRQAGLGEHVFLLLALSGVLAVATYELIEKRVQRLPPFTTWKPLLACMAAVSAASLAVIVSGGMYVRYPSDLVPIVKMKEYKYGGDARLKTCWRWDDSSLQDFPPECTSPDRPGGILVIGDSHAARLYPGLKIVFADRAVWQITQSACQPSGRRPGCATLHDYALRVTSEKVPPYVVFFAAWPNYTQDWSETSEQGSALASTIDEFARTGTQVVVLGPAPVWSPTLPEAAYDARVKSGHVPLRGKSVLPVVRKIDQQIEAIAQRHGAKFFSVNDLLCNEEGCLVYPPGKPAELMTWDYGHLTTAGAEYVARQLAQQLDIPRSLSADPD